MMHNALMCLFPDAKPGDWHVQDDSDGKGPYIKVWNRPEPEPTRAELDAASLQAAEIGRKVELHARIDSAERQAMLPRASREFMLTVMEQKAVELGQVQGLTPEQSIAVLRAGNLGYRRVKELDEQIEVLRGQL